MDGNAGALDLEVVDVSSVNGDIGALNDEGVDVIGGNDGVGSLDRQGVEVAHQVESRTLILDRVAAGDLPALALVEDVLPRRIGDRGVLRIVARIGAVILVVTLVGLVSAVAIVAGGAVGRRGALAEAVEPASAFSVWEAEDEAESPEPEPLTDIEQAPSDRARARAAVPARAVLGRCMEVPLGNRRGVCTEITLPARCLGPVAGLSQDCDPGRD